MAEEEEVDAWGLVADVQAAQGEVAEEDLAGIEAELHDFGELERQAAEEDILAGGVDEAPAVVEEGDVALIEQQAALAAAEEEEEDEEGADLGDLEEHLKDAVEGSERLKRLLSRDDDAGPSKKRKISPEEIEHKKKVMAILTRWNLQNEAVCVHVLESLPAEELEGIRKSNYAPDRFNQWKTPSELLAKYCNEMRERQMVGGSPLDCIAAFKFRWKLTPDQERALRALPHKHLRHVIGNFDSSRTLEDIISEARAGDEFDDGSSTSVLPQGVGTTVIGRFSRLELIDPLADAAVFGDANLTFCLRLAKHRTALGHVGRVISTTFEDLPTLRERYKEIDTTIVKLEEMYSEVYHGVDCTRIAMDARLKDMEGSLGAVYYNFPHSGVIQGFFDGHPCVNWRHENLMRLFFRGLRTYMKPGGFVKVASNMSAVGVRYSYIVGGALENEFLHVETVPFLEWHLHRYGRSYGDKRDVYKRPDASNNQSYNAQRAEADMVYCFVFAPTGNEMPKQPVRLPPTLSTLKRCMDGPFKSIQLGSPARNNLAIQLHKRFVTEVSGTHVG